MSTELRNDLWAPEPRELWAPTPPSVEPLRDALHDAGDRDAAFDPPRTGSLPDEWEFDLQLWDRELVRLQRSVAAFNGWPSCSPQVRVHLVGGRVVPFHPLAAGPLKLAAAKAYVRTSYGRYVLTTSVKDWTWWQCYACRRIRGSASWSAHSVSIASDIRPWANPMRDDGVLVTDFTRFGVDDGVEFVRCFHEAGFRNGITWNQDIEQVRWALNRVGQRVRSGRVDAMHLELVLLMNQVRSRDWTAEIAAALRGAEGGDEMGHLSEDAQKWLQQFYEGHITAREGKGAPKKGTTKRRGYADHKIQDAWLAGGRFMTKEGT